jgi:YidC/Oxa1 family membrane protein insertase
MNQARSFLLIAWLLVAFLAWEAWQKDYAGGAAPAAGAVDTDTPAALASPAGALPAAEGLPEA